MLVQGAFVCTTTCNVDGDCPRSDAGTPISCCSGICVDTAVDARHCGACGAACAQPPGGAPACAGGHCVIGACDADRLDCDGDAANGCEVNPRGDVGNCGACGKACAGGANQANACTDGVCSTSCNAGFADCDADAANGCEVDTRTDTMNCGACGGACAVGNGLARCQGGACAVDGCNPGFGDCNQSVKDGCETDLRQDTGHCGGCGNACQVAHGAPLCRNGSCAVAACDTGFADCNMTAMDGCEVSVANDPASCGGCGRRCSGPNSMQGCQMGACQIDSCAKGYSDCDKKVETGCESDVGSDLKNCGGCGNACAVPQNGNPACVNGVCGLKDCQPGFADCNMMAMDGCEADLTGLKHCGGCGKACVGPQNTDVSCNGGVCAVNGCLKGFSDCDGNPNNGCEARPCPACVNGVQDGDETDIDCGGKLCEPCKEGKACVVGADCESASCDTVCCQIGFQCDIFGCIPVCVRSCKTCSL